MTAPWFGPADAAALRDFFVVYDACVDMKEVLRLTAQDDPSFETVARAMAPQFTAKAGAERRRLLREAIAGDWAPYEAALGREGEIYAENGIAGWSVMTRALARIATPALVAAYEAEPRRLAAALVVMHEVFDRARGVLSKAYFTRRESVLADIAQRWRRMIDSTMVGVWVFDAEGKSKFMNTRMAAILRVDPIRGLQIPVADFVAADQRNALDERLNARKAGVAGSYDSHFRRADGTEGWGVFEASPLYARDGSFEGVITMCIDVTERKTAEAQRQKLEEQLRQAQKMEAIGRLAGGVAHDFNNLLSVVLSYADVILAKLAPDDPMKFDVQEIRNGGARAADLTRQLLMFSRQQVLEPKVVDLCDILRTSEKMLRRIVGEDIDLVTNAASTLRVLVDPGSIEQVIMNLVVNARDAMPRGGKLTMETADIVLDAEFARVHVGVRPGPHVMLAVSDTGVGMEPETAARVFEPFFTTKDKSKGTGLGLSTAYGIIEQSGGTIWLYSELGSGSTFKVYLPSHDAPATRIGTTDTVSLRGSETILLVEDQDQVRAVARLILVRHGYKVLEARGASEAFALCEQHADTIDLLLSDVVMPEMSGPELAERLARLRPGIKVLCMSGYTDDSVVRHGLLEARMAFLQKPITPDTLTRKVREVLDAPPQARIP